MPAAKKSFVRGKWRRVGRFQHQVLPAVDQYLLFLGEFTPKEEDRIQPMPA